MNDIQVFNEVPAAKYVVETLMQRGIMNLIYDKYESCDNKEIFIGKISQSIHDKYGFRDDVIDYVINGIANGIDKAKLRKHRKNHLTFNNIELKGKIQEFVDKMLIAGCQLMTSPSDNKPFAIMTGNFAGEDNCEFYICGTNYTKTVHNVQIRIPLDDKSWKLVLDVYYRCKRLLTMQYGKPNYTIEKFYYPYSEGDSHEIEALKSRHAQFGSYIETRHGEISIEILTEYILIMLDDEINSFRSFDEDLSP